MRVSWMRFVGDDGGVGVEWKWLDGAGGWVS